MSGITKRKIVLNHASAVRADLDWLAWGLAITIASLLRVDFEVDQLELWGQIVIVPIAGVIQLAFGGWLGLYDGRHRQGSFEEAVAVGKSVAFTTPVLFAVDALASDPRMVPLTATLGGAVIAFALMCATRWASRLRRERRARPEGADVGRLIVVGAGVGGEQVITSMLTDPQGRYVPVAILEDDPEKRHLRLRGVPVVGTVADLPEAAREYGASTVLIAVPSASRELVTRVTALANEAGLTVKVLPSVRELLDGTVGVPDIRDLAPADLLGRHEIDTDVATIAGYITGRRVLVTGAGGSIGSELCRQLARFEPAELVMLDRDESALHAVKLSIAGMALLDTPDVVLCDIRDEAALAAVFDHHRPQVVFHAAALKHLPMLQRYPLEGWKTNVLGTLNVARQSARLGVERFVNVSTDKAADPVSVLGYTKRIAERLTASIAAEVGGAFLSVRFGNVLGSRGSMLDTFTAQIEAGGPVTVTHPEITRFFMTVAEACELIIQAGALGRPGQVLVLDMGRPVRIADVAKQLTAQSHDDIEIVFTGLRDGEKLHEVLFGEGETDCRPVHPLISHVDVPPLDPQLLPGSPDPDAIASLARHVAAGESR